MLEHHRNAIDSFVAEVASTGCYEAVILTGSLAQGRERPDSDLDVYLVASEKEYAERAARHDLAHAELCDYPGGYVDGKVISLAFLEAAADRGSEPTRASFRNATVVHSSIGELQPLIDRIGRYPEQNRSANITDFYCQFTLHAGYFGPAALKNQDPFLLHHALSNMTLYAGRLILAHNRELYPCPKQLLEALERCSELPDDFVGATTRLLREPDQDGMRDYLTLVASFRDWGVAENEVLTRFMALDEWGWVTSPPPVAHR